MAKNEKVVKHDDKNSNILIERLKAYNITKNKIEVCQEFLIYFTECVFNNFLGKDAFETQEDLDGYIFWCFTKTCEEIELIYNFDFKEHNILKIYCNIYANECIKKIEINNILKNLINVLRLNFNVHLLKHDDELEEFFNLYTKFFSI
jgi:hypothetical protein